jgi:2-polyprenyl-3-methyl-5-hydroxy-6-metoxy-1,4-benzoquinol methylase
MISNAYFDQFTTPKYHSKNPLQRWLIRRFVRRLHALFLESVPARKVLEIGVGEGFLSGHLSACFPETTFTGVDLCREDLERLNQHFPHIEIHQGSIYHLDFLADEYDTIVCAEVLEHLDTPERALDEILKLHPKRILVSVPHEPWFMLSNFLRGKNLRRWGNDPEHVNHWNRQTFRKLLERRFKILRLTTSYPWILALLAPRQSKENEHA